MFYTILFLAITALALTFIITYVFRNPGPWRSFWAFLAVLFLVMFAFILWVPPVGPVWYDIAWFDALLIGLILTLLLGAAGESRKDDFARTKKGEVDLVAEAQAEPGAASLFGIFFWVFIVMIGILVVIGLVDYA